MTPTSFFELLSAFGRILKTKRKEAEFSKNRLVRGLEVLEKAGIENQNLKRNQ